MAGKIKIYRFMSAGCNGCDVQILETLVPRYKLAHLNVEVVDTPEQASVLAVTGGVNVKGKALLEEAYNRLNAPRLVVAVGNCAATKDIFDKGYPMAGPPDQIIPVNYYINGCPPRPQAFVLGISRILGAEMDAKETYWHSPEGFRGRHRFHDEKCIGCGACAQVCSSEAIRIEEVKGVRVVRVDYGKCTFCAFCQDRCPTRAIELTQDYEMITADRRSSNTSQEVKLLRCTTCGKYHVPEAQVKWIQRRVKEEVPEYAEYLAELEDSMKVCDGCRRGIKHIKMAKKFLEQLSLAIRM